MSCSEHTFTGIPLSTRPAHLHTAIDTAGHPVIHRYLDQAKPVDVRTSCSLSIRGPILSPIRVPMMSIVYFGTLAASLVRNDQGSAFPSSQMDSVGSNVSRAVLHM